MLKIFVYLNLCIMQHDVPRSNYVMLRLTLSFMNIHAKLHHE